MRFDSQFARMNCQIFSWGLSSGARGGSGRSEMFLGALRSLARRATSLIENENGVCAGGDFRCDFVEMELHGLSVASGQHEGSAGSALGAYRAEQVG